MEHKLLVRVVDDSPPAQSRFSTLPEELRRKILGYFSFEDVARTGILSIIFSSTRNWSEHSQVVLDKLLFERRGRWIARHPSAWVDKVEEILNNHREGLIPIQKFVLHIPNMQYKWGLYINIWLSYLSKNSIKELSVDNWNIITCKLSSILFEFPELARLMLRNCTFYKPFWVFQNLRFLRLEKIAFGSKIVDAVTISAPSLVLSEFVDCTGFQHLNIHAPKLENFVVASGDGVCVDDVKQMRLKLRGLTIDEGDLNCRDGGCRCRWGELGYLKYVFLPMMM
ncbi:hypothetical protein CsSME_00037117 [Camellia sinensis var. sinensis]